MLLLTVIVVFISLYCWLFFAFIVLLLFGPLFVLFQKYIVLLFI